MAKPKVQTKFIVDCRSDLDAEIALYGINIAPYGVCYGRWAIDGKKGDWVYTHSTIKEAKEEYPGSLYISAQDYVKKYKKGRLYIVQFGDLRKRAITFRVKTKDEIKKMLKMSGIRSGYAIHNKEEADKLNLKY